MHQVVAGVAQDGQVIIVVGAPRITPRDDVVQINGRRSVKPADLTPITLWPLLSQDSSSHLVLYEK